MRCMFPTCKWGQYILVLSLALLLGEAESLLCALKSKELPLQPVCSLADAISPLGGIQLEVTKDKGPLHTVSFF